MTVKNRGGERKNREVVPYWLNMLSRVEKSINIAIRMKRVFVVILVGGSTMPTCFLYFSVFLRLNAMRMIGNMIDAGIRQAAKAEKIF